MAIPSIYLDKLGGIFIFDCNCDINTLNLQGLPKFYIDILKTWSDIKGKSTPENCSQIRNETLWNNKNITIDGR